MFRDKTQQFDKSPRRVWSELLQGYVIDRPIILTPRDLTPEQIIQEQEEAEERAANF